MRPRAKHALLLVPAAAAAVAIAGTGGASTPGPVGRIVFSKEVQGRYQLFTVAPDGTGLRQLTRLPGDAVQADWSPDGRRLVFEYDRPRDKGCAVMLVNADGTGLTDLSPGRDCDNQPVFTPDGSRIVFVRYDARADRERITSMDLTGGDPRVIGGTNADTDPNVSPDGRTVTFVRRPDEGRRQALLAVDIDGGHLRRLTSYADEVAIKHDWAPDGRRIVVTTNADFVRPGQSANVLSLRPDGSGRRRLTHFTGGPVRGRNAFVGSYAPDGRHIALRVERDEHGGLAVMDADGKHLRMITAISAARPRYIDWGPAAAG